MDGYKKSLTTLNRILICVRVFSVVLTLGAIYLFGIVSGVKLSHAVVTGGVLGSAVFFCLHFVYAIERRALVQYLRCLEHKDRQGAIEWGKKYYAIKRLGFYGIFGVRILAEDERIIYHDIWERVNK